MGKKSYLKRQKCHFLSARARVCKRCTYTSIKQEKPSVWDKTCILLIIPPHKSIHIHSSGYRWTQVKNVVTHTLQHHLTDQQTAMTSPLWQHASCFEHSCHQRCQQLSIQVSSYCCTHVQHRRMLRNMFLSSPSPEYLCYTNFELIKKEHMLRTILQWRKFGLMSAECSLNRIFTCNRMP